MDLSREALIAVLKRHNYPTAIVTPEWLMFAVNLLIVEQLESQGAKLD